MAIDFILTDEQLALAEAEAQRRQSHNESKNLKGRNKAPQKGEAALEMHRIGCIGEAAVAYFLGLEDHLFIHQEAIRGSRDLPYDIEVKTRSKHGYDLLIQFRDDPSKIFVLTTYEKTANKNLIKIIGWARGRDVMRKELVREFVKGRACYAVPQKELRDIAGLPLGTNESKDVPIELNDIWITNEEDEMILNFSDGLVSRLGWAAGDALTWSVDPKTNNLILRKKDVCATPFHASN